MSNPNHVPSKVTASHQAKWAYVYVRQSSAGQMLRHGESTDLQYQLTDRAAQLGWPPDRVQVIDEDLGKSGRSAEGRAGFQHLLAEVGLGRVGLVLSIDASRLARNNSDWYQLIELCSMFGTLIGDRESLYDPRLYADRMLLGLSGMMSEAELHQLRQRLRAGAWNKAERGELAVPLPVGLVRQPDGEVIRHPDEEIQARLRLVFAKFRELGTAKAVVRYLRQAQLPLPSRPIKGPAPHQIVWQPAYSHAVLAILHNPAYVGAYAYGRTIVDATRRQPGRPHTGLVRQPIDKWPILHHNVYPAYISWEEFVANQATLRANQSQYRANQPGSPRQGEALLAGIIWCGRCGSRMRVRYSGQAGDRPVYICSGGRSEYSAPHCQVVRTQALDAEVEQLVLEALAPDRLQLALAALAAVEQEEAALKQQWALRLERANYEAERARRQYDAVEPENRLVARTLEKAWEAKLRAREQVEQEYQTWLTQQRLDLTAADRQLILDLGQDLPQLWTAETTTPADRKRLIRFVLKQVVVDQKRARGQVWFQLNWQTEAVTEHGYTRRVTSYNDYADLASLERRLRELTAAQIIDKEIAEILNREGFRTTKQQLFDIKTIWLLRQRWQLTAARPNGPYPDRWPDGTYSVAGAAKVLGLHLNTVYTWLRQGKLTAMQVAKGLPWQISLSEQQIADWREHLARDHRTKKVPLF